MTFFLLNEETQILNLTKIPAMRLFTSQGSNTRKVGNDSSGRSTLAMFGQIGKPVIVFKW